MASLLEKMGLVERRTEMQYDDISIETTITEQPEEVNLSEVRVDTLIEDIYNENNLADKTKSIFKVKELSDTLPKEMSNATKRTTVLGILNVSGLMVDEIINDGLKRTDMLNSVYTQIVSDCEDKIADANNEIENLKASIEALQKQIALKEAEQEQSSKLISDEIERIAELCKFITEETK